MEKNTECHDDWWWQQGSVGVWCCLVSSDCPEGALDSAAIRSSLLLSCVVLKAVLKQWRVPAFSKGGLADLPTLVGGSPLPSILHVSVPHRSLHRANLSSSVSVACTPPWPLLVWSSRWGLKAWGKRHPCAPIACGLCSLFLLGEAEESRCLHRWSQHVWWCCSSQIPDCWPRCLSVWLLAQMSQCLRHLQVHL